MRQCMLAGKDHAAQIERHQSIEHPTRYVFDDGIANRQAGTDVVVQDVQLAKILDRDVDDRTDTLFIQDVDMSGNRRAAFAFDHIDRCLRRLQIDIPNDDLRAFASELYGGGASIANRFTRGLAASDD